MRGFFNSRKFRQGTMATAITVVVVAIVIVINFVSTSLTERFGLVLDLTPTKLLSITDETKGYIADLPNDVVIYVLSSEEDFLARGNLQPNEILKRFDLESDRISLQYEDIEANPTFTQNYPTLELTGNTILVTSGDRVRDLIPNDLYDTEMDQNTYEVYAVASKAEQTLTSAILAVTSDTATNVAVISGHSEEDVSAFRSLLQANNYLVDEVSILTEDIDPSYTVAIIAGPVRDYSEEELQRLDRFLANDGAYGKTLFYLASYQQTSLPNLDAFLEDWGVVVGEGTVFETDAARRSPMAPSLALVDFVATDPDYAADVKAAGLQMQTADARPVSLAFEAANYISTSTLLQFAASAGIPGAEAQTIDDVEASGPITTLVMGKYLSYDGTTPLVSQVLASGSTALIAPMFLESPSLANSEYMLSLLDALTGKEEGVRIQSKPLTNLSLNMTAADATNIGAVFAFIFPALVLAAGLVIWIRRRHR